MEIESLNGPWVQLRFEGAVPFKTHYCPSDMMTDLVADLVARGGELTRTEDTDKGCVDLPGIVLADRPWEDLMIGEFKLGIPSQDFEYFAVELERSPVRRFASGKEYHKIHGWLVCVIMTPKQREQALRDMVVMLPEARKHQQEADARLEKSLDRMRQAGYLAPKPTLVPEPPKDRN